MQNWLSKLNRFSEVLLAPVFMVICGVLVTKWFATIWLLHRGLNYEDAALPNRWLRPGLFVFPLVIIWLSNVAVIPGLRFRLWRARKKADHVASKRYEAEIRWWLTINTMSAIVLWFGLMAVL